MSRIILVFVSLILLQSPSSSFAQPDSVEIFDNLYGQTQTMSLYHISFLPFSKADWRKIDSIQHAGHIKNPIRAVERLRARLFELSVDHKVRIIAEEAPLWSILAGRIRYYSLVTTKVQIDDAEPETLLEFSKQLRRERELSSGEYFGPLGWTRWTLDVCTSLLSGSQIPKVKKPFSTRK